MKVVLLPDATVEDGGTWDAEQVLRKVVLHTPFWRQGLEHVNAALEIHDALDRAKAGRVVLSRDAWGLLVQGMRLEGLAPQFGAMFNRLYARVQRAVLVAEDAPTE